jgi:hypothetical protein
MGTARHGELTKYDGRRGSSSRGNGGSLLKGRGNVCAERRGRQFREEVAVDRTERRGRTFKLDLVVAEDEGLLLLLVLDDLAVVGVLDTGATPLETSRRVRVFLRRVVETETLEKGRRSDLDGELVGLETEQSQQKVESGEVNAQTYRTREVQQAEAVVVRLVNWRTNDSVHSTFDESARNEGQNLGRLHVKRLVLAQMTGPGGKHG